MFSCVFHGLSAVVSSANTGQDWFCIGLCATLPPSSSKLYSLGNPNPNNQGGGAKKCSGTRVKNIQQWDEVLFQPCAPATPSLCMVNTKALPHNKLVLLDHSY